MVVLITTESTRNDNTHTGEEIMLEPPVCENSRIVVFSNLFFSAHFPCVAIPMFLKIGIKLPCGCLCTILFIVIFRHTSYLTVLSKNIALTFGHNLRLLHATLFGKSICLFHNNLKD